MQLRAQRDAEQAAYDKRLRVVHCSSVSAAARVVGMWRRSIGSGWSRTFRWCASADVSVRSPIARTWRAYKHEIDTLIANAALTS
jgi:hypothetical protein